MLVRASGSAIVRAASKCAQRTSLARAACCSSSSLLTQPGTAASRRVTVPSLQGIAAAPQASLATAHQGRRLHTSRGTRMAAGFGSTNVQEANELISEGAYQYLDVRTPEEFQDGHAPGAKNVPVMLRAPAGMAPNPDFLTQVESAFPDKGAQLAVGCKSGMRSEKAAGIMSQAGYTNLLNVQGGFDAWQASGLKVEK